MTKGAQTVVASLRNEVEFNLATYASSQTDHIFVMKMYVFMCLEVVDVETQDFWSKDGPLIEYFLYS